MNDLWQSYTSSLLGRNVTNAEQILSKLSKGDLNGAYITVKDSICHTMKGISGIVLFECTNMFYIITPKDALKSKFKFIFFIFNISVPLRYP